MAANKFSPMKENKITTPMFIKLLATSKVANSFFGFSNNLEIILIFSGSSCEESSKSLGDKEKKAVSAPDTIAVQKSKAKIPIKPKSNSVSMWSKKLKLGGSGSKLNGIN